MPILKKFSSRFAGITLALICIVSFGLMLWASRTDSAIDDELAHIPAGYGYVHNLDYRLNPEHPPLVKALAMLPVLFLNPTFPTQSDAWQNQVNAQWNMGSEFLYESGNDANAIIRTARIMPILLTILTLILVYFFARRLMGTWWALLPAFLFGLSPTILAHGHYVTTDVGAAFGILLGTYFFIRFVEAPTVKNLWLAGIAFGIAQVTKFSTPLLVPLFVFVLLVLWIRDIVTKSHHDIWRAGWRYLKSLVFIFLIGYICVVYPIYFLFTANYPITKQVSDTTFILNSFGSGPTPTGQMCHGTRCLADLTIWMAKNPVLRPVAQYALGILMVLQRADGGNTIYFMGHIVGSGGWIYFPLLYLLKEPLPTLVIVITALVLALWWMWKKARASHWRIVHNVFDYVSVNPAEFTMISFIVLYWGYSMHSTLNIGIRHIIPTMPFIYILCSGIWKKWIMQFNLSRIASGRNIATAMAKSIVTSFVKYSILVFLLVWLFCETIFAAPYFLSYFNEIGGGTINGYRYVTDSNYDWGQDLLRLQIWIANYDLCVNPKTTSSNPMICPASLEKDLGGAPIDKIAIDYFGGSNPKYELGAKEVDWSSSKGNPADQNIHWLAVSVNTLEGATQPLADKQTRNASDSYSWLTTLRPATSGMGNVPPPDFRIGTSIFVYHL